MSLVRMSFDQDIDGILWGVKWDLPSLTYCFATATNQYFGYQAGSIQGFETFNQTQRNASTDAINQLKAIFKLNITFTNDPSQANLRFAEATSVTQFFDNGTPSPGTITTAIGTPPDDFFFPTFAHGDMFYNRNDYNNPVKGNFAYATILHELGHTLGLKHGHVSQNYPDNSFTIPALPANRDSLEFSIMTYRSNVGGQSDFYRCETFGFAQTYMVNDIAALQYLYGADFTTNSGNTVYSWSASTGEMFIDGVGQGAPGANRVFLTVWDGNGNDTYNFSNYSSKLKVELDPGSWSLIAANQLATLNTEDNVKARANVFNALLHEGDLRSLIENAIGGSNNDTINGNVGANALAGNGGNDKLRGENGNDTLLGGNGNDTLDGGSGEDQLGGGLGQDKLQGRGGNDSFFFAAKTEGGDRILDFSSSAPGNNDRFTFESAAFGNLADGTLAASRFQSSNAATAGTSQVRFFYEEDTQTLRYDPDGNGNQAASVIAILQAGATMTSADIFIL